MKAVRKFMKGRKTNDYIEGYCDPLLHFLRTIGLTIGPKMQQASGPLICEQGCSDGCLRYLFTSLWAFYPKILSWDKQINSQIYRTQG
jgi:hypothetical protein